MPDPVPAVKAAEWFLSIGFKAFPVWGVTAKGACMCPKGAGCDKPGKHPSTPNGFKNATDNPDNVRTFLSHPGTPNYGLVAPNGVIVVDVDGDEGKRKWDELQHKYGPLPATLTVNTANGWHFMYRVDPERIGKQLFGFITRTGDTGYSIGPGSHHASGITYGLTNGKLGIQRLPDKWVEEGWPKKRKSALASVESITVGGPADPSTIGEGNRHDYLRDRARSLRGIGLEGQALFDAVWSINEKLPKPKTPDDVLRAIGDVETKFDADPVRIPLTSVPTGPVLEQDTFDRLTSGIVYASAAVPSPTANDWLVEGLLRPKGIAVLAGPEGLGKSWVRAELAIRLSTGTGALFDVYPVRAKQAVLLLDEENGEDIEYDRETEICDALGLTRSDLTSYARLSFGMTDLETKEGREALDTRIEAVLPALLIIDTGGVTVSEEHGPTFVQAMRYVRALSEERGIAILFIVHLVKPSHDVKDRAVAMREGRTLAEVMGHWGRHADSVWQLSDAGDGKVHFDVRKRWGESKNLLVRDDGLWRAVKVVTPTIASVRRKNDHRILEALKHLGGSKGEDIKTWIEKMPDSTIGRSTVFDRLKVLESDGFVSHEADIWSLTPAGDDEVVAQAKGVVLLAPRLEV